MADYKLQVSFKSGDDLVNVVGNTPEELAAMLAGLAAQAQSVAQSITTVRQANGASAAFQSAGQPAGVIQGQQQQVPPPAQPQYVPQPPAPTGPTGYNPPAPQQTVGTPPPTAGQMCAHGPRKWAQGTNKQGQPYAGYYCAAPWGTPKEAKCPPLDANGNVIQR